MSTSVKMLKKDDLTFDGKNIIIPGYWTDTMLDMINNKVEPDDVFDASVLSNFLLDVQEHRIGNVL